MRRNTTAVVLGGLVALGSILVAGRGLAADPKAAEPKSAEPKAADPKVAAPVKPSADGVVVMEVTDDGFVPQDVQLAKGKLVKLRITRRTDSTCAKAVEVPGLVKSTELPLGKQVEVAFTPTKAGKLRYGCAMGQMVGGSLIVE